MLTVKQVAEKLGVSATIVYQLVERGKIACHRIGLRRGAIRISEDDLTAYLASCRRESLELSKPVHTPPEKRVKFKHLQLD